MPKLLIIVVLVIGAAIVMYQSPGISPLTMSSTRGVVKVEGAPPDAPAPEKAPDRGTPHRKSDSPGPASKTKKMPEQAAAAEAPSSSQQPSQAAPVAPPKSTAPAPDVPFPTPDSLKRGSSAAEIRGRFGSPAFDIVGSREGHVLEKFYYVNRDKSQLTVLYMDNGALASAESVSSPYFQLPGVRDSAREPQVIRPR